MLMNNFGLEIAGHQEDINGYVRLRHGEQYSIVLKKRLARRADVELHIDGKLIGIFRIGAYQDWIVLDTPPFTGKRFTAYLLDSPEGRTAELAQVSAEELGVVRAVFRYEKQHEFHPVIEIASNRFYSKTLGESALSLNRGGESFMASAAPAGTGLSGHSDQQFRSVDSMEYDEGPATEIALRIIVAREDVQPLRSRNIVSSGIPPAIK